MDPFNPSQIQASLKTRVFGRKLLTLPRTGSTNDVARELAAQGAPEGTVVVADEQVAGRGRLGRRWLAPPGTCLLCSILFRPDLHPTQAQCLTQLCSLAAADAIHQIANLHVAIKWPNDLIVENPRSGVSGFRSQVSGSGSWKWRKLGGILTESGVMGERLEFVVVGIGVNVNVEPGVLPTLAPDATSVLAEVGRPVDRVALLVALLSGVERRYGGLQAGASPHAEWAARLATLGQPVTLTTPDGTLTGVAEAVGEDGALLVRAPDGALRRFLVGDVTLARPAAE